jgi:hypothetical protein
VRGRAAPKRPYRERARLVRLLAFTVAAGLLIVALGLAAVVLGVFEPSREERARGWVEREYGAELGTCEDVGRFRLACELERPTPELLDRLGRPAGHRVCIFLLENEEAVLEGYGDC